MRYEDYYAERMKDPAFREVDARVKRHLKYWGWYYNLQLWLDYFLDWVWEKTE